MPCDRPRGRACAGPDGLRRHGRLVALPDDGTVHVWLADIADLSGAAPATADEELWAQRLLRAQDRLRFVAGRALTRDVLGRYLDCPPENLNFDVAAGGKPCLVRRHGPDVRFNLSHSGRFATVAISTGADIGIDIEQIRPLPPDTLANAMLSLDERQAFETLRSTERPVALMRCWTRKEAMLKAAGTGLSCDPRQVTIGWDGAVCDQVVMPAGATRFSVRDIDVGTGASCAVALAAPIIAVEMRRYSPTHWLARGANRMPWPGD